MEIKAILNQTGASLVKTMLVVFMYELMGTAVYMFALIMSNGSSNWVPAMTLFAVMAITRPISGGHCNPGVTLSVAVTNYSEWKRSLFWVPLYIFSQLAGGFIAMWFSLFCIRAPFSEESLKAGVDFPIQDAKADTVLGAFVFEVLASFLFFTMNLIVRDKRSAELLTKDVLLQNLVVVLSLFAMMGLTKQSSGALNLTCTITLMIMRASTAKPSEDNTDLFTADNRQDLGVCIGAGLVAAIVAGLVHLLHGKTLDWLTLGQSEYAGAKDEFLLEAYIGPQEDSPAFQMDNAYLLTGWRINFFSYKRAFFSLFVLHNETVNIWSHFLGCFSFVGLIFYEYLSAIQRVPNIETQEHQKQVPVWPLLAHIGSFAVCLFLSAYYHLFCCVGPRTYGVLRCIDFSGILFSGIGQAVSLFYYGWICEQLHFQRNLWIAIVEFVCILGVFLPKPSQKKLVAIAVNVLYYIAFIHLKFFTDKKFVAEMDFWCWISGQGSLAVGNVFYLTIVPERFFSKTFDTLGASHQLLHIWCVLGLHLNIRAATQMYHSCQTFECPVVL